MQTPQIERLSQRVEQAEKAAAASVDQPKEKKTARAEERKVQQAQPRADAERVGRANEPHNRYQEQLDDWWQSQRGSRNVGRRLPATPSQSAIEIGASR
jgi:hypothetical protein